MNVYCITGYPGSGKSTATSYLKDQGIPVISMGDIVRELALQQDDVSSSSEVGKWATSKREEEGDTYFAKQTCEQIQSEYTTDKIVIDGLRSSTELQIFEQEFESVEIIVIDAPFEIRFNRVTNRGRDEEEQNYTKEEFHKRDKQEEGWGLSELIPNADHRIDNTNSIEHLHSQLNSILNL